MIQFDGVQLPLAFGQTETFSFDDFLPASNVEAVQKLQSFLSLENHGWNPVFLWGTEGVGKSHLLQALCRALSETSRQSVYLPLGQKQRFSPALLDGLESLPFVCLDDVDQICGDAEWEQALFNLFNQMRDKEHVLVMTAGAAPSGIGVQLADLASRLNGCLIYQLQDLDDAGKLAVLINKAEVRGFDLPPDVAEYLIKRLPRNMHTLSTVLNELDKATLAAKRKLTIPFVRELTGKK